MRKCSILLLVTLANTLPYCGIFSLSAQSVDLGDFIGLDAKPSNSDAICATPIYPEISDELEGLTEGD
ncbi:MAG: hypothetical protein ACK4IY_07125, partial [Chitinophagales bacterium]